jgi:glycerophosphoryl diester phosphodiesterase
VKRHGRGRVNKASRIQVHGHRGARAIYPENTLPAFEYAIACGVDALELDLALTRDNVLVASHDPAMNPVFCEGPAGPGVIRKMTLAQLQEWDCGARANPAFPGQQAVPGTRVPTFDQVLALAPRGEFDFNVETKIFSDRPELTPRPEEFVKLIHRAALARDLVDRLILQSFDFRTLSAMRRVNPWVRRSALFDRGSTNTVRRSKDIFAHIISPHWSLATPDMVRQAHDEGMAVVPWTANTEQEWDALLEADVDGIITDDPGALITYLGLD